MLGRRFNDAMEHISYLLKESPDNPELLQLLGQCDEAMGEDENAQKSYEKAIEYSPKQIDTYPRLANLLRKRLEKPKEAYDCMQNLVKNNPDFGESLYLFGQLLAKHRFQRRGHEGFRQGDIDPKEEAMKAAEKALELSPDDADALLLAALRIGGWTIWKRRANTPNTTWKSTRIRP